MFASPAPSARAALFGLLGLLLACDPAQPDKAAAAAATPTPAPAPEAAKGVPYDECLAACASSGASADDKATCRLNCKESDALDRRKVGAAPSPARADFHDLHACRDACTNPDDLAGCANACLAKAARSEPVTALLPADKAEALQPCAERCLGDVMNCSVGCAGEGASKSADDRATCRLQCDSVGVACLEKCA